MIESQISNIAVGVPSSKQFFFFFSFSPFSQISSLSLSVDCLRFFGDQRFAVVTWVLSSTSRWCAQVLFRRCSCQHTLSTTPTAVGV